MSEVTLQAGQSISLLAFHRKMLRDKPLGGIGGLIFALFLFCGIFADLIAPYGMNETDMHRVLQAPSLAHWMGTDHIGRDVFSRIFGRVQVVVASQCPPPSAPHRRRDLLAVGDHRGCGRAC